MREELRELAPAVTGVAVVRILPEKGLEGRGVVRHTLLALGAMVRVLEHGGPF